MSRNEAWPGICGIFLAVVTQGKRWQAFLQNHREVIVAFDVFTVPTVTFLKLFHGFATAPQGDERK